MYYFNDERRALNDLWDLIKCFKTDNLGFYLGLKRVDFDIPFEFFEKENKIRHFNHSIIRNAEVLVSIDEVVDLLSDKNIRFHHLSCAGKRSFDKDSALCIHYKFSGNIHAVAVPGLTYIPDLETQRHELFNSKYDFSKLC